MFPFALARLSRGSWGRMREIVVWTPHGAQVPRCPFQVRPFCKRTPCKTLLCYIQRLCFQVRYYLPGGWYLKNHFRVSSTFFRHLTRNWRHFLVFSRSVENKKLRCKEACPWNSCRRTHASDFFSWSSCGGTDFCPVPWMSKWWCWVVCDCVHTFLPDTLSSSFT